MSISSALNAGVSGLSSNASRLATISDNIANASTFGYKRADVDFSSVVISQNSGRYSAGGVTIDAYREVESRGTLVSTSNSTDLAVGGRGMLPVTTIAAVESDDTSLPLIMVSTGSFRPDDQGYLRSESGLVLTGFPADSDGNIPNVPRDSSAGLEPIIINRNQFTASPTTEISLGANLPADETQAGATGDPIDLSIEYFDNVGASQTLTLTFTPDIPAVGQSDTWNVVITDGAQGGAVVAEYDLQFDNSTGNGGSLLAVTPATGAYDGAAGVATFNVARGPIELGIGAIGTSDALTQLSAEFAPTQITKNGSPVGNLTSVEVDENGYVVASYDSGFTRIIYQVPLVDVANPNGLTAVDNQAFRISDDSGPLYLWDAGQGPTGEVIGYAREESTADIAAELTSLIQTQRAYSSNAKVIQTVDEMLQETTNLKR
ncbi:flagellar hook protein FlgE [Algicella marina]|uniref:Flagellar hook protein FlgE n=1 Tax=Algicella marina TaxID=2683284 RepID=A0A6P1T3P6_9RHOB|nr:flagellar hook-basal body complex protein [Algicella marina]QHQ36365.1 flagellar hook-basal body complex protein [Algicella marina]